MGVPPSFSPLAAPFLSPFLPVFWGRVPNKRCLVAAPFFSPLSGDQRRREKGNLLSDTFEHPLLPLPAASAASHTPLINLPGKKGGKKRGAQTSNERKSDQLLSEKKRRSLPLLLPPFALFLPRRRDKGTIN